MTLKDTVAQTRSLSAFVEHLDEGSFMLCRCQDCRGYSVPNAEQCEVCGSVAVRWQAAVGNARLVSWAYDNLSGAGESALQPVVIAQFSEGPWWWGRLVLDHDVPLEVDARLRVDVVADAERGSVPVFRLAS